MPLRSKTFFPVCFVLLATIIAAFAQEDLPNCTAKDSRGNYFDLRPLTKSSGDDWVIERANSDSDIEFRINVCAELVYKETGLRYPDDVAAFGRDKGHAGYDFGKVSTKPFFRGEKLLLEYKNGGECPNDSSKKHSTLISFICDANVAGLGHPVFVGDADKCSFWFEWATPLACAKSQRITTWALFVIIIFVFTAVYCLGGVFYNRIVHSASGLDQIPNYEFWYNSYDWTKDMTVILAGTVFSFFNKPRSPSTYRGLPRDDEENTLIGEFEEES